MPTRSRCRLAGAAAVTLVVGCISCSKGPTTPSPGSSSSSVTIVSLRIVAPQEIAPRESVQLVANAVKSDGSIENVTSQAQWTVQSAPTSSMVLSLTGTGLATGRDRGRGMVTARIGDVRGEATIFVLPKGTFRLAGRISGNGVGIVDAALTVIAGIGEGLSARTDAAGDYELYGVAGSVLIRASKAGYVDRLELVDVIAHGSLMFELPPTPSGPQTAANYAGIYTLTVTGARCTTGFPEDGKRRAYTARIDQGGSDLRVTLTGAHFLSGSGAFAGTVTATGEIHFYVRPSSVWDYDGPDLMERLGDGTELLTHATIYATRTPAGISGTAFGQDYGLGGIYHLPPRGASWSLANATGSCYIERFELAPQ